jgi:DNA modification methylase
MNLLHDNALHAMRQMADCTYDFVFCDPPYNLDTKWRIERNPHSPFCGGYVVAGKAKDFMGKWQGLDEVFLREYFAELFRIMKYGAFHVFYGFMRQSKAFMYYAEEAGFIVDYEPLAQYYISNFPKATDCSKMISKRLGEEREVVGYDASQLRNPEKHKKQAVYSKFDRAKCTITTGTSPLSRLFEGYKYGKACLKQTLEYGFIIQKPRKYGSFVDDALAWEAGELDISPAAFNIAENRINNGDSTIRLKPLESKYHKIEEVPQTGSTDGRFPAHTFLQEQPRFAPDLPADCEQNTFCLAYYGIDASHYTPKGLHALMLAYNAELSTAQRIDAQSGDLKGNKGTRKNGESDSEGKNTYGTYQTIYTQNEAWGDTGGASKALHKATFTEADFDIVRYCPKVSPKERNAGCEDLQKKQNIGGGGTLNAETANKYGSIDAPQHNSHPTLKSIAMNAYIAKLFKMPYDMQVLVPFSGAGSELLGLIKAGYNPALLTGIEIDAHYIDIAQARLAHWCKVWHTEASLHVQKQDLPTHTTTITPKPKPDVQARLF